MKEMGGQVAGALLIGASMTIAEYLLPPVLGEFKLQFPGVMPRLFVANSEAVQARIAERSLDVGFIEGDSHLPSLVTDKCGDDELQVICVPSHPLAKLKSASPQLLVEHAYVSREPGSGTREVIDRYLEKAGVPPDSLQLVMELGSPEAIKGLLSTGNGFAIMSRAIVDKELRAGTLACVPLSPALTRHFSAVYPKERFHSRLVNSFVQFAKERLAALPGASARRAQA